MIKSLDKKMSKAKQLEKDTKKEDLSKKYGYYVPLLLFSITAILLAILIQQQKYIIPSSGSQQASNVYLFFVCQ